MYRHKKESNQQSIALFGIDCTSMYMNLASGYMDIKENETDYSLGLKMLYLENQNPKDEKSKIQKKHNMNKIISKLKQNMENKSSAQVRTQDMGLTSALLCHWGGYTSVHINKTTHI